MTLAASVLGHPPMPLSPPRILALQLGMLWEHAGTAGGLDRIYQDLVRRLPDEGVDVVGVVSGPRDGHAPTESRVHGFAPQTAPMWQRIRSLRRLVDRLRAQHRFDVAASHFALYGAMVLDRLRDTPLVVHFHGPWSDESAAVGANGLAVAGKALIEGQVYRRAQRVVVLSRAFGDLVTQRFRVAEDRVRVIRGQIDVERFAIAETPAEARDRLSWPQDRPILVSVRRLVPRMGLDRLIAAMTRVVRAEPDALLCIGGRGSARDALERQVVEAGLQDHVRFLGFVAEEDLPLVYRAADLNMVPSVTLEGFGLVAAEALAAGTPSLVTPVGGLPEVVGPLSQDLVMRSDHPSDIADAVIEVLQGRLKLPTTAACRRYASAQFSPTAAAAATAAVYREIV